MKYWENRRFARVRVKKAPPDHPELQNKIVEGWFDRYKGVFQLRQHYYCDDFYTDCRDRKQCGRCPLIDDVEDNVPTKGNIEEELANLVDYDTARLLGLLFELEFSVTYKMFIRIPLQGLKPFYKALYFGGGSFEKGSLKEGGSIKLIGKNSEGIFVTDLELIDMEPCITGFPPDFSYSGLKYSLIKQILIGLVREWYRLKRLKKRATVK